MLESKEKHVNFNKNIFNLKNGKIVMINIAGVYKEGEYYECF